MLVSPERGAPWKYLFNDLPSQVNIGSSIPPIDVDDGSVWIQFPHHDDDTLGKVWSILGTTLSQMSGTVDDLQNTRWTMHTMGKDIEHWGLVNHSPVSRHAKTKDVGLFFQSCYVLFHLGVVIQKQKITSDSFPARRFPRLLSFSDPITGKQDKRIIPKVERSS